MEDNRTENAGLELAVNTDFAGESTRLEQIRTTLERIAQAGFTHIHWCHEWDREYMYSPYEMQQVREWMDEYGLKSKALHSTKGSAKDVNVREGHYRKDYTSDWEYNRRAGVDLIKNRVDLAQALGAAEIVLHLYVPYITILLRLRLQVPGRADALLHGEKCADLHREPFRHARGIHAGGMGQALRQIP